MRTQVKIPIGPALRAGAAGLGLLFVGATGYSGVDAQMPAAEARIDAPAADARVQGVVEVRGRATVSGGGRFAFYRILIGEGRSPAMMRPLGPPHDGAVENGVLATWDTERFPSGDYLLMLRVYADDDSYDSASVVVTVQYKPTPTPMPIAMPNPIDAPTPIPVPTSVPAPVPNEAPPAPVAPVATLEGNLPVVATLAPLPTMAVPREVVPIQPIPADPQNPAPFPVVTPTQWSPSQLPGDPPPIYLTPINFNPPTP